MLYLIENGDVYDPAPRGLVSILIADEKILHVGKVDKHALDLLTTDYEVIDADGFLVLPGLIDPHEHLLGASGVGSFGTAAPPIFLSEVVSAGITTVVGTLGTDTTTYTMAGLLARVKGFNESGITAFCYTGGYVVPPATITDSIRNDILFMSEVVGAGEVCISDERSTDPDPIELARLVSDTYVAGQLSGKAGVTHFHVGPRSGRLGLLRKLVEEHDTKAEWLYPTHVERDAALMDEALEFVRRGSTVDIDVVEKDLPKWLRYFFDHDGDPRKCTVSSDSFLTGPHNLWEQLRSCVLHHGFQLEHIFPLATSNTADVLQLRKKGRLRPGMDADVLLIDSKSLSITDVFARGGPMVRGSKLIRTDSFLHDSDRRIELVGGKNESRPRVAIGQL
jgi:beta-aspartyl-dipeptidase (metallo-type)